MSDAKMHMLGSPNKTYCGRRPKAYQHTVWINEITCEPCVRGYKAYVKSLAARSTEGETP